MQKLQLKRQSRRNGERNKMEHKCSKLQGKGGKEESEEEEEAVAQQGKRQRNKKIRDRLAKCDHCILYKPTLDFDLILYLNSNSKFAFAFPSSLFANYVCTSCVCVCVQQNLATFKCKWAAQDKLGQCAGGGAGRASTWPIQLSFCIVFSLMFAADNKPLGICQSRR